MGARSTGWLLAACLLAVTMLAGCASGAVRTVTRTETVTVTAPAPSSSAAGQSPPASSVASTAAPTISGTYPHGAACRSLTNDQVVAIAKIGVAAVISSGNRSPNYLLTSCDWKLQPLKDCNCGDVEVSESVYHSSLTPNVYRNSITSQLKAGTAKPITGIPDSSVQALSLSGFATLVHGNTEIEIRVRLDYVYTPADAAALAQLARLVLATLPATG